MFIEEKIAVCGLFIVPVLIGMVACCNSKAESKSDIDARRELTKKWRVACSGDLVPGPPGVHLYRCENEEAIFYLGDDGKAVSVHYKEKK